MSRIFPHEEEVEKIGGRLLVGYRFLKRIVLDFNENKLPLLQRLGFPVNLETALQSIHLSQNGLREIFVQRTLKNIEAGNIPKGFSLPQKRERGEEEEATTPTGRKRLEWSFERELSRKLKFLFNKIYSDYLELNPGGIWEKERTGGIPDTIQKAITFSEENGLGIDIPKFIKLYRDYIQKSEEILGRQHQAAADGLNVFFGGSIAVTWEEMEKYFLLEDGIVKVNPNSVNKKCYDRLGSRVVEVKREGGVDEK